MVSPVACECFEQLREGFVPRSAAFNGPSHIIVFRRVSLCFVGAQQVRLWSNVILSMVAPAAPLLHCPTLAYFAPYDMVFSKENVIRLNEGTLPRRFSVRKRTFARSDLAGSNMFQIGHISPSGKLDSALWTLPASFPEGETELS